MYTQQNKQMGDLLLSQYNIDLFTEKKTYVEQQNQADQSITVQAALL